MFYFADGSVCCTVNQRIMAASIDPPDFRNADSTLQPLGGSRDIRLTVKRDKLLAEFLAALPFY